MSIGAPVPTPDSRRSTDALGVAVNAFVLALTLLATMAFAVLWFIVDALSTTPRGTGIGSGVVHTGWIAIGVFTVAFVLSGAGLARALHPGRWTRTVSLLCALAAAGVQTIPVMIVVKEYNRSRQRDRDQALARQRVDDLSAIGRVCNPNAGPPMQGDCPRLYNCTTGLAGGPQTSEMRCQVMCVGRAMVCGGRARCIGGLCVVGP